MSYSDFKIYEGVKNICVEVIENTLHIKPIFIPEQRVGLSVDEINHLRWIFKRLVNVHGENMKSDYMIKFARILESEI